MRYKKIKKIILLLATILLILPTYGYSWYSVDYHYNEPVNSFVIAPGLNVGTGSHSYQFGLDIFSGVKYNDFLFGLNYNMLNIKNVDGYGYAFGPEIQLWFIVLSYNYSILKDYTPGDASASIEPSRWEGHSVRWMARISDFYFYYSFSRLDSKKYDLTENFNEFGFIYRAFFHFRVFD